MKMSQARYNDLVYMGLKYGWFEPLFGEGAMLRQADIRVVMQLGCPVLRTGVRDAVLWPGEKAPADHGWEVEVDTDEVLAKMREYMEGHWMKQAMDKQWWKWVRERVWPAIIEAALSTPEEECAEESPIVCPKA